MKNPSMSMELRSQNQKIAYFVFPAALSFIFVILGSPGIPDKYFIDSQIISNIASGSLDWQGSFKLIAELYNVLGLTSEPIWAAVFTLVCFYVVFGLNYFRFAPDHMDRSHKFAVLLTHALGTVYFGQMTKELIMLVAPFVLWLILRQRNFSTINYLSPIIIAVFIGLFFRPYWMIVGFLYFTIITVLFYSKALRPVIVGATLFVSLMTITYFYQESIRGTFAQLRDATNGFRLGSENALTMIPNYYQGNSPVDSVMNSLIILVLLFMPIPLFLGLNPSHFLFGMVISIFWYQVLKSVRYFGRGIPGGAELIIVSFVLSLIATQSLFEPDYGSYLKHLAPFLPVISILIFRRNQSNDSLKYHGFNQESSIKRQRF